LRRRPVALHAFEVADYVLGVFLLLIYDAFQVVVLLIDLLHDLLLEADLARDTPLHSSTLVLMILASLEDLLKFLDLLLRCHLKRLDLVALVGESAIEA